MNTPTDDTQRDEELDSNTLASSDESLDENDESLDENDENADEEEEDRMEMDFSIESVGACKRHVKVTVPREEIDRFYTKTVKKLKVEVDVPGFRTGRVPEKLIEKRFRKELKAELKQKILLQSLDQIEKDDGVNPINEPDIDVEAIQIPEEGDFTYEFYVEVAPEFDVPKYEGIKIEKPIRNITDEDVETYLNLYLEQYGTLEEKDTPANPGDHLTITAEVFYDGKPYKKLPERTVCIKPTLRYQDAELEDFDTLMTGVQKGSEKKVKLKVSMGAAKLEMRGEPVEVTFRVQKVSALQLPELNEVFWDRLGFENESELRMVIRGNLERQSLYDQRQLVREQVIEKLTESASWELPEDMVLRQVENALRRQILEMQQAGFTTQEIRSRENELRQEAIESTRQALKEHFVLDRIATEQKIQVTEEEINAEIEVMAIQRGESSRRLRSRLEKSGMIENLFAQLRERKAVDYILSKANFVEKEAEPYDWGTNVEAIQDSICVTIVDTADDEAEDEEVIEAVE